MSALGHSASRRPLLASFALALVTFLMPWLVRGEVIGIGTGVRASEIGSLLWVGVAVFAFFRLRKRALWLLLGLPFTFFWVFVLIMIAYRCGQDPKACIS